MTRYSLSRDDARDTLARVGSAAQVDPYRDFHALPSRAVDALLAEADRERYKVPRHANGSRARYYHARLIRAANRKES